MDRQKIFAQNGGALNDQERLDLCRLLVKAGYTVRITSEKFATTSKKIVEYWKS